MKYKCRLMSTKPNVNHFTCIAVNQMQARILSYSAMTQKYFLTSKTLNKEENELPPNSKIQETDPHWFHFDSVHDVFTCANCRKL